MSVAQIPHAGTSPVQRLGEQIYETVADIGDVAQFSGKTHRLAVPQAAELVGPGAQLLRDRRLQRPGRRDHRACSSAWSWPSRRYSQFEAMGMATRLGSVINISLVKELGPVLAATMLAGRVGSSMAAELGTMRVTEQIDALSALGTNPIQYLVVPRFLACVLLIPLLTLMADFMGVIGGAVGQHADPGGRLVPLLAALAELRRGARPLRRGLQELLLRRGDRPDQLPPRVPLQGRGRGGRAGRRPRRSSTRSSRSCSSTSASASSGTRPTTLIWPDAANLHMSAATTAATPRPSRSSSWPALTMRFRQQVVLRDISLTIPRGQTALRHRRERLRQDRPAEAHDRPAAADAGARSRSTAATSPTSARPS